MLRVSVTEARKRLDELIAQVERGERLTLTRYGKPVAEIIRREPGIALESEDAR